MTAGNRDWARKLAHRYEVLGEHLPIYAVRCAEEVLGRQLLRGGKHARRPDAKDRQANDRHEDAAPAPARDEMVVL